MMDSVHPRWHWTDFDDLKEPPGAAGGFMLAVPFDTLLRELSETYLQMAWQRVAAVLERFELAPADLSWGALYRTVYAADFPPEAPASYVGWVSRHLAWIERDPRCTAVDAALRAGQPTLGCAFSLRSHQWRIAPNDAHQGLQLIEALVASASGRRADVNSASPVDDRPGVQGAC